MLGSVQANNELRRLSRAAVYDIPALHPTWSWFCIFMYDMRHAESEDDERSRTDRCAVQYLEELQLTSIS
jgi:hypothetical protein